MSEISDALEIYLRQNVRIEAFERLKNNPDFQAYRELVEGARETLRDILENPSTPQEEIPRIRGQLEALRNMLGTLDGLLSTKSEVARGIEELRKAKQGERT